MSIANGYGNPQERIKQLEELTYEQQRTIERLMDEVGRAGSILGLDFTSLPADVKNPLSVKAQEVMQQLAEEKAARERAENRAHHFERRLDQLRPKFVNRSQELGQAQQHIKQLEAQIEKAREAIDIVVRSSYKARTTNLDAGNYVCPGWALDQLEAALARPQEPDEPDEPESLPLMARETAERLDGPSVEIGNLYATVNGKVYRIADTDEHGLPVVVREPGMEPWAKYVHRSNGWISYYRDLPDRPDTEGFQRIEEYNEQEADHG